MHWWICLLLLVLYCPYTLAVSCEGGLESNASGGVEFLTHEITPRYHILRWILLNRHTPKLSLVTRFKFLYEHQISDVHTSEISEISYKFLMFISNFCIFIKGDGCIYSFALAISHTRAGRLNALTTQMH